MIIRILLSLIFVSAMTVWIASTFYDVNGRAAKIINAIGLCATFVLLGSIISCGLYLIWTVLA